MSFEIPPEFEFLYDPGSSDPQARERLPLDRIQLERTECFGECPVYRLMLSRDGRAAYEGMAHVERMGRYVGEIPLRTFARLVFAVQRISFMDFDEDYSVRVTDLPSTIITVVESETGAEHRVRDYGGQAPPEFWMLAETLDAVAARIEWSRWGDSS